MKQQKRGQKRQKHTQKGCYRDPYGRRKKDYDRLKEMDLSFRYTVSGLADRI